MTLDELINDWNGLPPKDARIPLLNDETLRDGLQSPSVRDPDIAAKRDLIHRLARMGVDAVDLGMPGAGPKALAAVRALMERRGPEVDQILLSLAATLKQAEAFMGRFAAEDYPELAQSLKSLRRSLASVEELLELLKAKPSRAVWGTPSQAEREQAKKSLEAAKQPAP